MPSLMDIRKQLNMASLTHYFSSYIPHTNSDEKFIYDSIPRCRLIPLTRNLINNRTHRNDRLRLNKIYK